MQETFGRLTVIESPPGRRWLCQCECGSPERWVSKYALRSGHSTSCGCRRSETCAAFMRANLHEPKHGGARTREYRIWDGMRDRCKRHKNYAGRGITVCERWNDFANFLADMGPRPPGLTIDRIDNNGNYEPGNCRWATMKQQLRNTRVNRIVEYQGRTMTLAELAEITGVPRLRLDIRLQRGLSVHDAINAPLWEDRQENGRRLAELRQRDDEGRFAPGPIGDGQRA